MDETAKRIFALLKEKGIEQKEFAVLIGTTDKTVSTWSTGRTKSYRKYIPQIALVLETTVEYLLTGEKEKPIFLSEDGLNEKDGRLLTWFRSLPAEKQKAILIAQDAPKELVSDLDH